MIFNRQPVPELPVADVAVSQQHYRDFFGCEISWITEDGEMGAVTSAETVFFLRRKAAPIEPAVQWVFTENLEEAFQTLQQCGARIIEAPEQKPWGLFQFTAADPDGNLFVFYVDRVASGEGD
jgi:uncharacterized glyoxalase superfamily protein PhnB